ncbi:MAG: pyridoxal phosphate-dependent class II aminotransferase [Thalassovita sp.]
MNGRDHGGGVDAAVANYGGHRDQWVDLSTGINPVPYPIGDISQRSWATLPDQAAQDALLQAARRFWNVPDAAAILAAPGASSLIARIPALAQTGRVHIPVPTYNEHAAAFATAGWQVHPSSPKATAQVLVHPNNPTGQFHPSPAQGVALQIIDESFCDVAPAQSHIALTTRPGTIVLKSFGKFWGLAGLRLGFAIGDPDLISTLADMLGPWPVAGPALSIATRALNDPAWATQTRADLVRGAARLDRTMTASGAALCGGTSLFRLYEVENAAAWQDRLAQAHIWSRIFPYSDRFLRLGLPAPDQWTQVEAAL